MNLHFDFRDLYCIRSTLVWTTPFNSSGFMEMTIKIAQSERLLMKFEMNYLILDFMYEEKLKLDIRCY